MTEKDLGRRADDYEERLAAAGSTEGLIGALVKGAERSKKTVKYLFISLMLDLLLSFSLGFVAIQQQTEADKSCVQSAKNSIAINQFLQLLIANTKISTTLTPIERQVRIKGYKALIVQIPECYKEAVE